MVKRARIQIAPLRLPYDMVQALRERKERTGIGITLQIETAIRVYLVKEGKTAPRRAATRRGASARKQR